MRRVAAALVVLMMAAGCSASDQAMDLLAGSPSASDLSSDPDLEASAGTPLEGEVSPGPAEDREPTQTEKPGLVGTKEVTPQSIDDDVEIERGVTVKVLDTRDVQIAAEGPGEIAGPGTAVRIQLRNDTDARLDLGGVAVTLTVGDLPASESYSPPTDPFRGMMAPGDEAIATYAFLLPEGATGGAVLRIEYSDSRNAVVVRLPS